MPEDLERIQAAMSGMPEIAKRVAESMSQITQVLTAAEKASKRTTKVVQDSIASTRKAATAATAQATAVSNQGKQTKEVTRVLDSFNISLFNFKGNLANTHKATSLMIAKLLPGAVVMERLGLSTAGASDQAKKLSAAQIAQGAGLAVVGAIISGFLGAMGQGIHILRTFTGGVSNVNYNWRETTVLMGQMGVQAALAGIKIDELDKAMDDLTSAYSIQSKTLGMTEQAAKEYIRTSALATVSALGYGRAVGMSADDTTKLINAMVIMGEPLDKIDRSFAELYTNARQAGINVADFADALKILAPSSHFVNQAASKTVVHMKELAAAIIKTNTPLFQVPGKLGLVAQSLQGIATASSQLDIPALLAFGSTMGNKPGNLADRLDEALSTDRVTILERYTDAIVSGIRDPQQKVLATMLFLRQNGIQNIDTARTAAKMLIEHNQYAHEGNKAGQTAINNQLQQLRKVMQDSIKQDPMDKVIQLLQSGVGMLSHIDGSLTGFLGGRGNATGMPMTGSAPLPEMFSTRIKTGRAGRP